MAIREQLLHILKKIFQLKQLCGQFSQICFNHIVIKEKMGGGRSCVIYLVRPCEPKPKSGIRIAQKS